MRAFFASVLTLAVVAVVVACSGDGTGPCNNCPNVAGTYAISATAPTQTCPGAQNPPALIDITQVGSIVRANTQDFSLQGTLYDTFVMTLSGFENAPVDAGNTGTGATIDFRGQFVQGGTDAGVDQIVGTWTFTPATDAGAQPCAEPFDVTMTRR